MADLKECPHCKAPAIAEENDWSDPPTWSVACSATCNFGPFASEAEAAAAWNTRAALSPSVPTPAHSLPVREETDSSVEPYTDTSVSASPAADGDVHYIEAALSWYAGGPASDDVREAWTRLKARLAAGQSLTSTPVYGSSPLNDQAHQPDPSAERERIARIVEPRAFEKDAGGAWRFRDARAVQAVALAKADAIMTGKPADPSLGEGT